MRSPLDLEVMGDANQFKGTDYHLLYALWLLLVRRVGRVEFYRGNDLLATLPPDLQDADEVVRLGFAADNGDWWVQLKATQDAWTPSDFLRVEDHLLSNFIFNVLQSRLQGRQYHVQLITQGVVSPDTRNTLSNLISGTKQHRDLQAKLKAIVAEVKDRLHQQHRGGSKVEERELHGVALSILAQLLESQPVRRETLIAEIERELAYLYPDRELVTGIRMRLLGALLDAVAPGPGKVPEYDARWLDQAAGRTLALQGLFDTNPLAACDEATTRSSPLYWDTQYYVARPPLENALRQFVASPEPLFVLVGMSGAGKSWAVANWTIGELAGRARLLIPGSDLDRYETVEQLLAGQLRRFTSATDWSNEIFLKKIRAAAIKSGRPLMLVIDNLPAPGADRAAFQRKLAHLVADCRANDAKLVLTCQQPIWEFYDLAQRIPPQEIFSIKTEPGMPRQGYSFLLGDLTPDELSDAITRRLPSEYAEPTAFHLRAPGFAPLRNPYLLDLYLREQSSQIGIPNNALPVDVDNLLDLRIRQALERITPVVGCGVVDLQEAFDALREQLWLKRPSGLTYVQASECLALHLRGQSELTLAELRQAGLLTTGSPIQFAEPAVAERLFAKQLRERMGAGENVIEQLRPEEDTGVVIALLREAIQDPVSYAEILLGRDPRWLRAVSSGLAQAPGAHNDYRVLAMLTGLARPKAESIIGLEACEALGQLATRGERAWQWVEQMYRSDRAEERYRGSAALATAIEYDPERVGAVVEVRLSQALVNADASEKDQMERRLDNALDPLIHINHRAAASMGQRIIERWGYLVEQDSRLNWDFARDVDEARGTIALVRSEGDIAQLLVELRADDRITRYRAARALRRCVFERPESVRDGLCAAIQQETDIWVMSRLLWMTYPLTETAPDALLTVLEDSSLVQWQQPSPAAGLTLALLGDLADRYPSRVARLLPQRLDAYDPAERAFLSEILAYAWWHCAEAMPEFQAQLAVTARPDLEAVSDEYRVFALRGAAVGQLGLICLGMGWVTELRGQQIGYPHAELQFLYTDTGEFTQRHVTHIVQHPDTAKLQELLLECIREEERVPTSPLYQGLYQGRPRCAKICLEMIIHMAEVLIDPMPLLHALPDAWQPLHAVWRLLDAGRNEPALIAFAQDKCSHYDHGGPVDALEEREQCLAQLARLPSEQYPGLDDYLVGRGQALGSEAQAIRLANQVDHYPADVLTVLDTNIRTENDLPALYEWEIEARSWPAVLITRVYARMFAPAPILVEEARNLCVQMLATVRALPDSLHKQEYEAIYGTIARWLEGDRVAVPLLPTPSSALQHSHTLASELLLRAYKEGQAGYDNVQWLLDELADRRGWWETGHFWIREGSPVTGSGHYTVYVLPAVRLAYVAVAQGYGLTDPSAQMILERVQAGEVLAQHEWVFRNPGPIEAHDHYGKRALAALLRQAELTPRDERLWLRVGDLHLRFGHLAKAENILLHQCLTLRSCDDDTRASAYYDLACTYARMGRDGDCQAMLHKSIHLRPLDAERRDWLQRDSDLAIVRDLPWFRTLLEE